MGPDGAPLLGAGASGGGLSDRELQLAKGVSLRAPPVPFFAATGGASGGATVGAAATPSGATVDDMASVRALMGSKGGGKRSVPKLQREPSALEVRRGYQAAEAQHLADVRDDKARRAAVQDLAAVEAAQEAAARARGVVAAAACVAAWDVRKAHTVCKAAAALRKRQSAVDRKKTAQGAVAAHAADAAAVKVARAVAAKAAKRARRNGRADVTALAARLQLWAPTEPVELEVPFLVDSGAGVTFIDHDTYVKLGSPPYRDSITVSDVSNTVTTAHGIGPLGGYILDASGAWVPVLLAKHAYTSEAFGLNLFSVGEGLKAGWDVSFTKNLLTRGPVEVPLQVASNTWSFQLRVARGSLPADIMGAKADLGSVSDAVPAATTLVYAKTARLNHFGRAGRQAAVHWLSQAPPLKFADGEKDDCAASAATSAGGGGVPAGASAVADGGAEGDGVKAGTAASEGGDSVTTDSLAASVTTRTMPLMSSFARN